MAATSKDMNMIEAIRDASQRWPQATLTLIMSESADADMSTTYRAHVGGQS